MIPRVLTIAGSDCSGGAGIQADLKTFSAYHVYGMSVVTAVTVQNTLGVSEVFEIPDEIIGAQFDAIAEDIGIDAAKTGMLPTVNAVEVVVDRIRRHNIKSLVVDTVMNPKKGKALQANEARDVFIREILPLASIVTANIPEAEIIAQMTIGSVTQMKEAAKKMHDSGVQSVLIKGGHLDGSSATDVYYDGSAFHLFEENRIATKNTHGTGCTLSAAIAANLALGLTAVEAIGEAKKYITGAIRHSFALGSGHGPLNHFWKDIEAVAGA